MTEADLQRIESELRIVLPRRYRSIMLAYPFGAHSPPALAPLPNNADRVIQLNQEFRGRTVRDTGGRKANFFLFGTNYGIDYLCLDLAKPTSPVYRLDRRTLKATLDAASFAMWVRLRIKWYVAVDRESRDRKYTRLREALGRSGYHVSGLELKDGWDRVRIDSYFWVGRIKRKWYAFWWMGLGFRLDRSDQLVDFCLAAVDGTAPNKQRPFVKFMTQRFAVTRLTERDLDKILDSIKS